MAEVVVVAEVAEAEVLKIEDDVLEVVESRTPDGLAVLLRARPSGRHYRVAPTRDPRQPRFWCLMVIRCSSAGVPHPSELPWAGGWGTRWEDLATDLALIRADVNAWLAQGGEAVGVRAGESYVDVGTLDGYRSAMQMLRPVPQDVAEPPLVA